MTDYNEYVRKQSEKLNRMRKRIEDHDRKLEEFVFRTHSGSGSGRVLCLAARLGGEVRAFKRMGCDAIGVDLNPGEGNPDVIDADVHDLPFDYESFDHLYCNSIDHVLYLDQFFSEAHRVLKENGVFIMDVIHSEPGKYEVRDLRDDHEVLESASKYFSVTIHSTSSVRFGLVNGSMTTYHATRRSHKA